MQIQLYIYKVPAGLETTELTEPVLPTEVHVEANDPDGPALAVYGDGSSCPYPFLDDLIAAHKLVLPKTWEISDWERKPYHLEKEKWESLFENAEIDSIYP